MSRPALPPTCRVRCILEFGLEPTTYEAFKTGPDGFPVGILRIEGGQWVILDLETRAIVRVLNLWEFVEQYRPAARCRCHKAPQSRYNIRTWEAIIATGHAPGCEHRGREPKEADR